MHDIQDDASNRPRAEDSRTTAIEAEHPDRGIVHSVEDGGTGTKVVELLGNRKVAHVEDDAEDPGGHGHIGEHDIEPPQRVRSRDVGEDLVVQAIVMREEVARREEHARRLLDAKHTHERPFPVELDYRPRGFGGEPSVGDDMLACVVAFGGARPEEESAVEGCGQAR